MTTAPHNTDAPFTQRDIERFNNLTHFPKEVRKENAKFAEESAVERTQAEATLKSYGKETVPGDIDRALERLRAARYQVFMATVRSRELAPPWSVVGPARYDEHARPQRAQKVMSRAFEELNAARAMLAKRLRQHGPAQSIRSDDDSAVAQLEAKIKAAEAAQEKMKAANKILRDPNTDETWKIAQLESTCGIKEAYARELMKPDFAGRIGFPGFKLSNNAANIRRMQDRVQALAAESSRETVTLAFPGGRVEDSAADCRIKIYHDEKPSAEVIARLKAHGFHWSYTNDCWQRLRNNAARHAASVVTGVNWSGPGCSEGVQPVQRSLPAQAMRLQS